ncbi:MAG: class I SAM-dependent methyltransferase [Acidimicrobiales bacterium]
MPEVSRWVEKTRQDPGHSTWYVERFRKMAAEGADLAGEARFIDAVVGRGARILDAGCGPGRVGGELHRRGHTVIGVDVDPVLIEAAGVDHPGPTWLVGDLAELDLPAAGITEPFDAIVSAGNVMTVLAPSTRTEVLTRLGRHLADQGRLVVGFGAGRDYGFDAFRADAAEAGLAIELELSSWDLRPFTPASEFLVAVLRRA